MPAPRARQITLTATERRQLNQVAYSHTAPYQQVIRVRIVLDAARGYSNAKISQRRGVTVDTVRTWRNRYAEHGMAGLKERPRPGRPPRFTPVQVAEVKALACQLPAETAVPLSRWSCPDLADEVVTRGISPAISASTIRRILAWPPTRSNPGSTNLIAFERRYNATARPFKWKFTPADLEDLLTRIERHEQDHQPASLEPV